MTKEISFLSQNSNNKTWRRGVYRYNDTSPHSITNGISSNDPLSGKLFDTGIINPKGYAEFVASNLNPGKYPFYSIKDPSLKGEIIVISEK